MKTLLVFALMIILLPAAGQQYFNNGYFNNHELEYGSELVVKLEDENPYHFFTYDYDTIGNVFTFHLNHYQLSPQGSIVSSNPVSTNSNYFILGSSESIKQTSNNQFIYAGGYLYDLIKIDDNGNFQWGFDQDSTLFSESVIELSNGNYVVSGARSDFHENLVLTWVNDQGIPQDTVFHDFFLQPEYYDAYRENYELPNGDLLLSGWVIHQYVNENFDEILDYDPIMCRLNSSGQLIWFEQYEGFYFEWQHWIEINEDANTAICAAMVVDSIQNEGLWDSQYTEYWGNMAIREIDLTDGHVLNEYVYEQTQFFNYYPMDFLKTPDGGYAILGNTFLENNLRYPFILKTDSLFNFEWSKIYPSVQPEDTINMFSEVLDFEVTPDGGFIVGGYVSDGDEPENENWGDPEEGILPSNMLPWVFKTDACGDLEWNNCGVGVEEIEQLAIIKVYPNPAIDLVNVLISAHHTLSGDTALTIKDMLGREVLKSVNLGQQNRIDIDVSEWEAGVYILLLSDMNQAIYKSVLIVN
jgi:hypothetical protein